MSQKQIRTCSTLDMWSYSSGEIANSLVMNAIYAFAMLYYTDALGLPYIWAGWAMFIAIFWDAVSDPLMGHISDNTRSKYGKRHQYILFGGIVMVAAFYFIWMVPSPFRGSNLSLFWYLVVINLILRTAYTVFVIPLTALGFEMCQDYTGRTKIQGIKAIMGMIANILGPAFAWAFFFPDEAGDPDKVASVKIASNYVNMGTAFAIAALLSVFFVTFITRKYIVDSRDMKMTGAGTKDFFKDMSEILKDSLSRWVFAYCIVVIIGIQLVAGLQMYLYEHFMHLDGIQKTITHGGTMVGMMAGAAFAAKIARRLDKKKTVYVGGAFSVACGVILTSLFLPGILKPEQTLAIAGFNIPIAMLAFAFFNSAYWFGNGVMLPVATSMMADISELNEINTGINKDGAYSAMYSFTTVPLTCN